MTNSVQFSKKTIALLPPLQQREIGTRRETELERLVISRGEKGGSYEEKERERGIRRRKRSKVCEFLAMELGAGEKDRDGEKWR